MWEIIIEKSAREYLEKKKSKDIYIEPIKKKIAEQRKAWHNVIAPCRECFSAKQANRVKSNTVFGKQSV